MTKELRTLHVRELRVATSEDGGRTISGLVTYNTLSCDLGGFRELLAPGCFAGSLTGDVLLLRDHEPTLLMGRTKSGTLTLTDSAEGLRFSCRLPKTTTAGDLAESIDRGDLDGVSFGFIVDDDKWAQTNNQVVRTVLSAELLEISPCSFAAYLSNVVSVRSCPMEMRSKLHSDEATDDKPTPAQPKQESRANDAGCDCDCPECQDNDCENCSDPECNDPECAAVAENRNADENRRALLDMKLALLKHQ